MNIREHIEAGHYPLDDKGRALVPTPNAGTFVCAVTDAPGRFSLLGWYQGSERIAQYGAEFCAIADPSRLLPPPPRKVKVTAWALIADGTAYAGWSERPSGPAVAQFERPQSRLIELTGEYEEPWP